MGATFKQSRLILRIEAEILPDGVRYRERDVFRSYETVISFGEIVPSVTTYFSINRWHLVICFGLLSLTALRAHSAFVGVATLSQVLWAGFWAGAACLGTWMRAAHYIGFRAGDRGLFFFRRAGSDDPVPFLDAIAAARHAYFSRMETLQDARPHSGGRDHGDDSETVH